jgi:hypothetical protein
MIGNDGGGAPRFTVGGVISIGLSALFANFFRFLLVMLVVGVPLLLVMALSAFVIKGSPGLSFTINNPNASQVIFFLLCAFIVLIGYFLIQSALTYGTLQYLRGQRSSVGACIAGGWRAAPRILLATVLLVVVLGLFGIIGFMIIGGVLSSLGAGLLIPVAFLGIGLYIFARLWVFVPAIVIERVGTLECFGRSMELTREHRWKIFAILILIAVANWAISSATAFFAQIDPVAAGVIDTGSSLFFLALNPVLAAAGYYYIRAEKEGVGIDDVVRVFD